jgi:glycine cleavage system aminomethyltransferase T
VVYGHTVGKILAFAYLKPEAATARAPRLEVVIARQRRAPRAFWPTRPMIRKACCRAPMP